MKELSEDKYSADRTVKAFRQYLKRNGRLPKLVEMTKVLNTFQYNILLFILNRDFKDFVEAYEEKEDFSIWTQLSYFLNDNKVLNSRMLSAVDKYYGEVCGE